jgi:hypothetical protein
MSNRQAIAEYAGRLLTAAFGRSAQVYVSRVKHLQAQQLPAIGVFAQREEADSNGTSPRRYERKLTLVVEIVTDALRHLDSHLNTFADTAEDALLADPTFDGLAEDCELERIELTFDHAGERPVGCAHIEFVVTYERHLEDPQLAAFMLGQVHWDSAPADGVDDAVDTIRPEQLPAQEAP